MKINHPVDRRFQANRAPSKRNAGDVKEGAMGTELTLYFGSVAEILIVLAVLAVSTIALTTGYSILKNYRRCAELPERSPAWNSCASCLLIAVQLVLVIHLIKAIVLPNWITLGVAGAIAVIQIVLNCIISRDIASAYLPLKHEKL